MSHSLFLFEHRTDGLTGPCVFSAVVAAPHQSPAVSFFLTFVEKDLEPAGIQCHKKRLTVCRISETYCPSDRSPVDPCLSRNPDERQKPEAFSSRDAILLALETGFAEDGRFCDAERARFLLSPQRRRQNSLRSLRRRQKARIAAECKTLIGGE